ncbi:MAG: hypothetical protein JHC31_15160 [Sulfurihydrogenibium sp.]|jgi:hypothetical protein|nr:hypothetical protein [Sulfurihydrogenibium sp.]
MSASDLRAKMKQMMLQSEDSESSNSNKDRFWNITVDSQGNGSATIRFLPGKDLSKLPYVTTYNHWFTHKVTGKTYEAMSSSTWKGMDQDPIGQFNAWLWKNGHEDVVRGQKRQTRLYANILVVNDPAKPENNGKVFIYKFGTKILEMIKAQLSPIDDEDVPVNVFDLFEGKNFRLKASMVAGYRNYDKSSFSDKITAVAETDEEVEEIYSRVYDLEEMFLDKSKNKSDEEKLKLMVSVFGRDPLFLEWMAAAGHSLPEKTTTAKKKDDDEELPWETEAAPTPKAKPKADVPKPKQTAEADSSVDDILASLGL